MARSASSRVCFRYRLISSSTRFGDFRIVHLEAFRGVLVQIIRIAQEAGLVKLGRIAIDGSKVRANASKHKAMSYDRMKIEEQKLEKEIAGLLAAPPTWCHTDSAAPIAPPASPAAACT